MTFDYQNNISSWSFLNLKQISFVFLVIQGLSHRPWVDAATILKLYNSGFITGDCDPSPESWRSQLICYYWNRYQFSCNFKLEKPSLTSINGGLLRLQSG